MRSLRSLIPAVLIASRFSSYATPGPVPDEQDVRVISDTEAFKQLLEQADPPALHAALHDYTAAKFRDGVFEKDTTAIEAVHRDDPSLATSILELVKRSNSSSVVTDIKPSTTLILSVSSASTVPVNPVRPSDRTTQATPVAQPGTSATTVVGPSTTRVVVVTTTPATAPSTAGPGATSGAGSSGSGVAPASQTTPAPGPASRGTSSGAVAGPPSVTAGQPGFVFTTTGAGGVVITSTVPGGVGDVAGVTSYHLTTYTLPNGAATTMTEVTVIGVAGQGDPATAGEPAATSSKGSLQSAGYDSKSRMWGWLAMALMAGATGLAIIV